MDKMPAGFVAMVTNVAVCAVVGIAISKTRSLMPLIALPFCLFSVKTTEKTKNDDKEEN